MGFSTIRPIVDGDVVIIQFLDRRLVAPDHVDRVGAELQEAIREQAKNDFIFDFTNVEFMSSAILGSIITADATVSSRSGRLCLCNLTPDLRKMLKMMKLDTRIKIYKSLEKAKASY